MGGETWKLSPAAVEQIEKQSDVEKGERGERSESERERDREKKREECWIVSRSKKCFDAKSGTKEEEVEDEEEEEEASCL